VAALALIVGARLVVTYRGLNPAVGHDKGDNRLATGHLGHTSVPFAS